MSYISLKTAFESIDNRVESSDAFLKLKNDLPQTISQRLADNYEAVSGITLPDDTAHMGYKTGYGPTSQEVLIPAFLAAYGGGDPNSVGLRAIKSHEGGPAQLAGPFRWSWKD